MITEATEIRGTAYRLIRLDPIKGGRLALRVGKALASGLAGNEDGIAKILAAASQEGGAEKLKEMLSEASMLSALAGGVSNLDTDLLFSCALECMTGSLYAGQTKLHDERTLNAHFSEHADSMLLVMAWALRVNCAGSVKSAAA